jgi:hypothetical protein
LCFTYKYFQTSSYLFLISVLHFCHMLSSLVRVRQFIRMTIREKEPRRIGIFTIGKKRGKKITEFPAHYTVHESHFSHLDVENKQPKLVYERHERLVTVADSETIIVGKTTGSAEQVGFSHNGGTTHCPECERATVYRQEEINKSPLKTVLRYEKP